MDRWLPVSQCFFKNRSLIRVSFAHVSLVLVAGRLFTTSLESIRLRPSTCFGFCISITLIEILVLSPSQDTISQARGMAAG